MTTVLNNSAFVRSCRISYLQMPLIVIVLDNLYSTHQSVDNILIDCLCIVTFLPCPECNELNYIPMHVPVPDPSSGDKRENASAWSAFSGVGCSDPGTHADLNRPWHVHYV